MSEELKNEEVIDEEKSSEDKKPEPRFKKKEAAPKKPEPVKPEPVKPYVHIDTFLLTAIPYYGLSRVHAQGFKSRMNGKHYQRDEQIFVQELKAYLNLK